MEHEIVKVLRTRLALRPPKSAPRGLRPAAVLIPLVVETGGRFLLLTRRARMLRRQPGDISFPGGAVDADESPLAAALRESREEVGLDPADVHLLGQMDERSTITGFRITPFVGAISGPYAFEPNHEVDELLKVPLSVLTNPEALRIEKRWFAGREREVYHYQYLQHDIWGITGQLVKEFLELIQ
jgi:8-oxo-dGTP pyrophosphatase MutT (NUDIX family)